MKHTQLDTDVAAINRAYRVFLDRGEVPKGLVPEFIERSWRRSAAYCVPRERIREVGRVADADLRRVLDQHASLINLAAPVMHNLQRQLMGTGSVVLLCSGEGFILHSMGDPNFLPKAEHVALKPGVTWAEQQKGTNAIGTAVVERQPVVVYAAQHYIRANHFLACSATPVLDPYGDTVGLLDITCDYRCHQRHTMALVQMTVRVIERQMFQLRFCRDFVFNVHPDRNYLGSPFDVQVAFSADGIYLAATTATCTQIGIRPGDFRGRFEDLFAAPLEQVLNRIGSLSPPVVEVRLQRSGMPVYLQLAQPTVAWKVRQTTFPEPSMHSRQSTVVEAIRHRPTLDTLAASDPVTRFNIERARRTLSHNISILIEGLTGTGKEWFAHAIHNSGPRAARRFVAINCAAISDRPIEAEAFGYEEGGLGAKIQQADGGTLFLDEIGEMSLNMQAHLLRILQERAITPRGGKPIDVDIAVISATQHRLHDLVQAGCFREDLYYRLNGLTLCLPPLRERKDLLELAIEFAAKDCTTKRSIEISDEVKDIFTSHPWHGNIRQLHSVIRSAMALKDDAEPLERRHLPDDFLAESAQEAKVSHRDSASQSAESLEQIELHAIEETIRRHNGNISAAARQLNVSRTTLYRRLNPSCAATEGTAKGRRRAYMKQEKSVRG